MCVYCLLYMVQYSLLNCVAFPTVLDRIQGLTMPGKHSVYIPPLTIVN